MNSKSKKRLSILKAKNIGKRYRKLYLKELEQLVITDIDKNRILSLEKNN